MELCLRAASVKEKSPEVWGDEKLGAAEQGTGVGSQIFPRVNLKGGSENNLQYKINCLDVTV